MQTAKDRVQQLAGSDVYPIELYESGVTEYNH